MSKSEDPLEKVQANLNYQFHDPALLELALTHPSYAHEHPEEGGEESHNQRLEFLGDAVLDFLVAAWLYRTYRDFPEGPLTRLRATLVRTTTLADLARELELGEALRLGRGEEESGGDARSANLCDVLEATIGALYLDGGLDIIWSRLEPWFAQKADAILDAESYVDAKSRFQEWARPSWGNTCLSDSGGGRPRSCQDVYRSGLGRTPDRRAGNWSQQAASRASRSTCSSGRSSPSEPANRGGQNRGGQACSGRGPTTGKRGGVSSMMRFDRFTERAQEAAQRAVELMTRYGHSQVDVEHLLLALVQQKDGTVPSLLSELGVDPAAISEALDSQLRDNPRPGIYGARGNQQVFITPRVKRVLDGSQEEATALQDEYISTEHILLAITHEQNTPVARLLSDHNINHQRVKDAIAQMRGGQRLTTLKLRANTGRWSATVGT